MTRVADTSRGPPCRYRLPSPRRACVNVKSTLVLVAQGSRIYRSRTTSVPLGVGSHADIRCPGSRLRTQPPGPPVARYSLRADGGYRRSDGGRHGRRRRRRRDMVSPFSMYRYDASYALEVYGAHPNRFRLVKPVDPTDAAVVGTIADWASTDGTVGIRVFLRDNVSTDPADPPSTVSWPRRRSIPCRSTSRVRGAWIRPPSWRPETPIRGW